MILTVTPNPALDLTYRIDRAEIGDTNRVPPALVRAGGKGLNVARALRQAGFDAEAVTTVGGATGAEFRADLAGSGIPAVLVEAPGATRRSTALVETATGRTTVLNERGVPLPQQQVDELLEAVSSRLADARCVVVSGSLPPGVAPDLPARVVELARARDIPCVVDATGDALIAAAAAGADALKPNRRELAESTGIADPVEGARSLLETGARLVFVSLGEDGMLAVAADRVLRARPSTVLTGNPTGAGDAAVAAIAACFASGDTDPDHVLQRAVAWSASAVLMPQAGDLHPSRSDLEGGVVVETVG
jgi:1-phosphofructokinase family hexose kinase